MSNSNIKELASFRAMLLMALTEGLVLETDDTDEEIQTKIDWWFKSNDTNSIFTQIKPGLGPELTMMIFSNESSEILFSNIADKKLEFYITKETKKDLNEFEKEDILSDAEYHQQMVDLGSTVLFVIRALHDLDIKYSVTPEVTDQFEEDEISEDDWGV